MKKNDPHETETFENSLRKMRPISGEYRFEPAPMRRISDKKHRGKLFCLVSSLVVSIAIALTIFPVTEKQIPHENHGVVDSGSTSTVTEIVETPEKPTPELWTMRKQLASLIHEMELDAEAKPQRKSEYPVIELIVSPKTETKIPEKPPTFPNRKRIEMQMRDFCVFDAPNRLPL